MFNKNKILLPFLIILALALANIVIPTKTDTSPPLQITNPKISNVVEKIKLQEKDLLIISSDPKWRCLGSANAKCGLVTMDLSENISYVTSIDNYSSYELKNNFVYLYTSSGDAGMQFDQLIAVDIETLVAEGKIELQSNFGLPAVYGSQNAAVKQQLDTVCNEEQSPISHLQYTTSTGIYYLITCGNKKLVLINSSKLTELTTELITNLTVKLPANSKDATTESLKLTYEDPTYVYFYTNDNALLKFPKNGL